MPIDGPEMNSSDHQWPPAPSEGAPKTLKRTPPSAVGILVCAFVAALCLISAMRDESQGVFAFIVVGHRTLDVYHLKYMAATLCGVGAIALTGRSDGSSLGRSAAIVSGVVVAVVALHRLLHLF